MNIFYEVGKTDRCKKVHKELVAEYPATDMENADVIVVIGGDGFMLQNLHKYVGTNKKVYGLNLGSVGFMMNPLEGNLLESIKSAKQHTLHPLKMTATLMNGKVEEIIAFNEVSLHRMTHQAIRLQISVSGKVRMEELVCDGALIATPSGSTAYNLSAHGPVLPIDCKAVALTPISAFRPRRWRGAILNDDVEIEFNCLDNIKRPVSVAGDNKAIKDVKNVKVCTEKNISTIILTDANHDLEERIISEQFY